jgi:putative protein-disulfide isomerase
MQVDAPALRLDYFFDPFCGWCYASAPALKAVAEAFPEALTMHPSGLFAGARARSMASMAEHSWRNATRIAELTGQIYTSQYRDRVLRNPHGILDSLFATRAIIALGELARTLEPALLHALQTARYVDARDTADASVVASVAAKVSAAHGYSLVEDAFAAKLANDEGLANLTEGRMRESLARMHELLGTGIPQLLATVGDHHEVIENGGLYGGAETVLKAIKAVSDRALPMTTAELCSALT